MSPDLAARIVFVSGRGGEAAADSFINHLPSVCIEKPFDGDTLFAILEGIIDATSPPGRRGLSPDHPS